MTAVSTGDVMAQPESPQLMIGETGQASQTVPRPASRRPCGVSLEQGLSGVRKHMREEGENLKRILEEGE